MLRRMEQKSRYGRLTSNGDRIAASMRYGPAICGQILASRTAIEASCLAFGLLLGRTVRRCIRAMHQQKVRVGRPLAISEA